MKSVRLLCSAILVITALIAIVGGIMLITDPTGMSVGYHLSQLAKTNFKDYLLPGWILLIFIGLGSVVAAGLSFQEENNYELYIMAEGGVMFIWSVVSSIQMGEVGMIQVILTLVGLGLFIIGNMIRIRLDKQSLIEDDQLKMHTFSSRQNKEAHKHRNQAH